MANSSLCLTPACLEVASTILWQMAPSWEKMDPCTNFEPMVCGRFEERNFDDQNFFHATTVQNRRVIREILERPYSEAVAYQSVPWKNDDVFARGSIDEANFNLVRGAYQACLNADATSAVDAIKLLLADLNSAWPINTGDLKNMVGKSDRDALTKATTFLTELDIPSYVALTPEIDAKGSEATGKNILRVTGPTPVIEPSENRTGVLTDPERRKKYASEVTELLSYYWPSNLTEAEASQIAEGITHLERFILDFDGVAVPDADVTKKMVKVTTVDNVAKSISQLDLERVIASMGPPNYKDIIIHTEVDAYWKTFPTIFEEFPKTIIQSWLVYRVIHRFSSFTDIPETGNEPMSCVDHVDGNLRYITARLLAGARLPEAGRKQIEEVGALLQEQAQVTFKNAAWMSADARNRTVQKAANMVFNIGYRTSNPDVQSPTSLTAYYKSVNITSIMLDNAVSCGRSHLKQLWALLTKPADRGFLPKDPPVKTNAFYIPQTNTVHMPTSFLQLPVYHPDLPSYAVFGGAGTVFGHEIFHGFDPVRRHFDETGIERPWWDKKTEDEYEKRAQCIVEQYNGFEYKVSGGKTQAVNGSATLAENLPDAEGIRVAYNAWKAYSRNRPAPRMLPGLEKFTPDQLFFIFFGSIWCNSFQEKFNDFGWTNSVHAHSSARVAGTTANSRAFREAFNCKVKEPTCQVF